LKSKYEKEELEKKLSELDMAIASGESIHLIVSTFSDLPRSSEIGWVSADDLVPEFADAVRSLRQGEFSKPIDLGGKICVLFASNERPATQLTLGDASEEIERRLIMQYQAEIKENYIKKLKDRAYIKIFL
jgi:parvulin-like peptidyl-prolyl isomerase